MLRQHPARIFLDLTEGNGLEEAGRLEAEREAADPRERVEEAKLHCFLAGAGKARPSLAAMKSFIVAIISSRSTFAM